MNPQSLAREYRSASARELARRYGRSYLYMRKYLSRHGIAKRKDTTSGHRIASLWHRGTPEEIAEYLGLSVATVCRVAYRYGLTPCDGRQYRLWCWTCHRVQRKGPQEMRLVHYRKRCAMRWAQLELFDEPAGHEVAA